MKQSPGRLNHIFLVLLFTSISSTLFGQAVDTLQVDTTEAVVPVVEQYSPPPPAVDPAWLAGLEYRMIGPYRGGRSTAVAGVPGEMFEYYMGTTGGGVWKTTDNGENWINISDGYFGGSIGAVTVAQAEPGTIYVGTGSACIRGNTSTGKGLYKSVDHGKTWSFVGLEEAGQIGAVVVHPRDADLVYVAALGRPFGKNAMRGVYRSRDGGASWEHILFASDSTGAVALSMNPDNPREIYAGLWRAERKPWTLISGSGESGVYKTTDGGDTWKKLTGGLPEGVVGKVDVSVSPANPNRVWAIIEAEPDGGVYRSDDAGATWTRLNEENKLRQRAWYYTHIESDPQDENTVYVLNTGFYRSVDGGRTFENIDVPHGDVHDLWINPDHPDQMVVANDGGAQVSVNAGASWSTMNNQPTAELYTVTVDNQFPYRVYSGQQDNSTISVPAWQSNMTVHPRQHWMDVGGCETGPVALHPDHPDRIYAGCYGGIITRYDRQADRIRNVMIYPQLQLGEAGRNLRHRFQWVSPIAVSPHDPNLVYHASQFVNRTTDGGMNWEVLSPDLTTNTTAHQGYSGGPINHDITGVEIYNTIFTLTVSPHSQNVVWVGSDDGLVHVTRDNGRNWIEITPPQMPTYGTVDAIEESPHLAGRAYMAVHRYRQDDFAPYIFRTNDYGSTWTLLTDGRNGIPSDHPVRVVREDPDREGLLYAGTEFGLYVSFDDGNQWQPLQQNLPETPVTDLKVAHQDLVVATQGRSFWILDDVTPLHQLQDSVLAKPVHLFRPRLTYRDNSTSYAPDKDAEPKPYGVLFGYYLNDSTRTVQLDILDDTDVVLLSFSSDSTRAEQFKTPVLEPKQGMNRFAWNLRLTGPELLEEAVLWGNSSGVKVAPGSYSVRLQVGNQQWSQPFEVAMDPRQTGITPADLALQQELAVQVGDTLSNIHQTIRILRSVRDQLGEIGTRIQTAVGDHALVSKADSLADVLTEIELQLTQTKNKSNQDPIRNPPRLDNQFLTLYGFIAGPDGPPTQSAYTRFADLNIDWSVIRGRFQEILDFEIPAFNAAYRLMALPAITLPETTEN